MKPPADSLQHVLYVSGDIRAWEHLIERTPRDRMMQFVALASWKGVTMDLHEPSVYQEFVERLKKLVPFRSRPSEFYSLLAHKSHDLAETMCAERYAEAQIMRLAKTYRRAIADILEIHSDQPIPTPVYSKLAFAASRGS